MRRLLLFLLVPLLLAAQGPVEIARSKTVTEGPVFDRQGNLYFSHRERLYKLTPAGEWIDWVRNEEAGFNGHKILPDGTHLVCASKKSPYGGSMPAENIWVTHRRNAMANPCESPTTSPLTPMEDSTYRGDTRR